MPGIPGGHPRAVAPRDWADEGQQILRQPEDAGPTVLDARLRPEQLDEERVERALDLLGGHFLIGHLGEDREVTETAEDDAVVRELLPVIETVPCVVGTVEQPLRERLGRDHLAAGGPDSFVEFRKEAPPRPVCGDDDMLGVQLVERLDPRVRPNLRARLRDRSCESPHEARRLHSPVSSVVDRAAEVRAQKWRQLVSPLADEAV